MCQAITLCHAAKSGMTNVQHCSARMRHRHMQAVQGIAFAAHAALTIASCEKARLADKACGAKHDTALNEIKIQQ